MLGLTVWFVIVAGLVIGALALDRVLTRRAEEERDEIQLVHWLEKTAAGPDEPVWIPGCRTVLEEVFQERLRQVERYGLNDECPDGTGSGVRWLEHTDSNLDLRTASEIEAVFRAEYERYEKAHGVVTWKHLIREELAEAFAEDDVEAREVEALQSAALLVSWVETSRRRRGC